MRLNESSKLSGKESFHVMAKPNGPICNLGCKYCFYSEKTNFYPNTNFVLSASVLEKFIKQNIEAHKTDLVRFTWQGGEPTLLGVDYFKNVVEIQKKYSNDKKVHNSFQTNGVLLDHEWCEFFKENDFLIGISIDGPREFHNKYRVDKSNKSSFDQVINGIELLKEHKVAFNTLTTVNDYNSQYPLEIYNFLKEIGSGFMQFIPIVERKVTTKNGSYLSLVQPDYQSDSEVTEWSVHPEVYGEFLIIIFDEWIRKDIGKYFVQIFDVSLESWLGLQQSLCLFCQTCGGALALEHNGDLYSCDHFVYPEHLIGNILDDSIKSLAGSPKQIKFGNDKFDKLPDFCLKCEVRFACNGGCPKHRFARTKQGEDGLNYLCAGYKKFFNYIAPYMRIMAKELRHRGLPSNLL